MTEPLTDTWHSRDMPILRMIAQTLEGDAPIRANVVDIADDLNVHTDAVIRAFDALESDGLIRRQDERPGRVAGISGDARRLLGYGRAQRRRSIA